MPPTLPASDAGILLRPVHLEGIHVAAVRALLRPGGIHISTVDERGAIVTRSVGKPRAPWRSSSLALPQRCDERRRSSP